MVSFSTVVDLIYENYPVVPIKVINVVVQKWYFLTEMQPPRWPSGKASASKAEDLKFESRLRRDFFGVESYQ